MTAAANPPACEVHENMRLISSVQRGEKDDDTIKFSPEMDAKGNRASISSLRYKLQYNRDRHCSTNPKEHSS